MFPVDTGDIDKIYWVGFHFMWPSLSSQPAASRVASERFWPEWNRTQISIIVARMAAVKKSYCSETVLNCFASVWCRFEKITGFWKCITWSSVNENLLNFLVACVSIVWPLRCEVSLWIQLTGKGITSKKYSFTLGYHRIRHVYVCSLFSSIA